MHPVCHLSKPPAKDLQGENLTLGRELKIRIFALAQGRQIITWGFQGESDFLECFCSIFLGKFAVEECESYRNKFPKDSEQYARYQQVRDYLESLGNRAAWISCELGQFPAVVPDLSHWQREVPHQLSKTEISVNSETSQATELAPNQESEGSQELWELAKKRLLESWQTMKLLHGKILKQKYEISSSMANTLALENCKATFKLTKRIPADRIGYIVSNRFQRALHNIPIDRIIREQG